LFTFNLYLDVGSEDAETEFGTIDLLCIISREVLNALCGFPPPQLFLYLHLFSRKKQRQNQQGLYQLRTTEPKS